MFRYLGSAVLYRTFLLIFSWSLSNLCAEQLSALEPLSFKQNDSSVSIYQGNKLVTTYQFRSGSKPIFWPILGPDGNRFTRDYPMVLDSKNEKHDHPHHRGLWMSFGDVNGHDLWAEGKGKGTICQVGTPQVSIEGNSVRIKALESWRGGAQNFDSVSSELSHGCDSPSEHLADCTSTYSISVTNSEVIIDCNYFLKANQDLHFGDTKEGMFAIRVPEAMKVDDGKGTILTSEGRTDAGSWGFPAQWVDYSGPTEIDSQDIHGISILVHPSSFQSAGRWHVRTYGLFAHNPFGAADFPVISESDRSTNAALQSPPEKGGYSLTAGKSLRFAYRVIFHKGSYDLETGNLRYDSYTNSIQSPE